MLLNYNNGGDTEKEDLAFRSHCSFMNIFITKEKVNADVYLSYKEEEVIH